MRLLLLGCTGFVGKELVPTLLNENHEIYIVSRKPINKLKLDLDFNKFKFVQIDLSKKQNWNNENLLSILRETDGIINLMGEPIAEKKWTYSQKQEIENSRINTTQFMMETLKNFKINPKVIINGSAIGYYGTSLSDEFTENSIGGKDFLANLCKRWEAVAAEKPFFSRLVIFRIGIVLEADGGALGKMLPVFKIGLGGPIGDGMQWMSWIHRRDLCALITKSLVDKKYSGVFNAVAPNPVLMKDFSKTLGKCLNRPNLLPVPGAVLKILLGDGSKVVLEGQKVISKKLRNFNFKYPLLEKAISASTKN
ncbi:TIGR01777 family oxidoreductase [Prochlorococcus marinus]|uniref:TIGR01777 family oxidoreductase n=1 Tax=Prochlorococcus marinus TaxID=1219 RepID=UPI001ADD3AFC|nr:TIGR01777 family oxidoreductase [Prochlorococcus marinus]MBO8218328.1 TIGR01777 family protein [Prochlorococcus marinus CUG1416]MBW3050737.1 TIGR01777 family protein [Prochlorococcus marinus str. MU1416]